MERALQYNLVGDNIIKCSLCNHRCRIKDGNRGICGVRINKKGILYSDTYAMVSSVALDPIEKKPLYHFLPGTVCYSIGSIGCNFSCSHCQNWHISQDWHNEVRIQKIEPETIVNNAQKNMCQSIAFTYNEPTLSHEYALNVCKLAHLKFIKTAYVTNGYITEEALREIAPFLDAFRVDLKAFSEEFYHSVCKAKLEPVLNTCKLAKELGLHVEIVTLIIPGLNDDSLQLKEMINWVIRELGPETPFHFTRFHPDFEMRDRESTPVKTLEKIYLCAKELGIQYPYLGNVAGHKYENTYCHSCGNLLIERYGYSISKNGLSGNHCNRCKETIPVTIS